MNHEAKYFVIILKGAGTTYGGGVLPKIPVPLLPKSSSSSQFGSLYRDSTKLNFIDEKEVRYRNVIKIQFKNMVCCQYIMCDIVR